jgi:hypothetical protein
MLKVEMLCEGMVCKFVNFDPVLEILHLVAAVG